MHNSYTRNSRWVSSRFSLRLWGIRLLILLIIAGCGGPTPNKKPPKRDLEIWKDPQIDTTKALIQNPFTTATPTIPVKFAGSKFHHKTIDPNQHNLVHSTRLGLATDMIGRHVGNHLNYIIPQKLMVIFSQPLSQQTRKAMIAGTCAHEICHNWFTFHTSKANNLMNDELSDNLSLYKKGKLPNLTTKQANKIKKTLL